MGDLISQIGILLAASFMLVTALLQIWSSWRDKRRIRRFQKIHLRPLNVYSTVQAITQSEESNRGGWVATSTSKKPRRHSSKPPHVARLLVRLLMRYRDQEALLGDLEEMYQIVKKKDGHKAATLFYYSQVIRSIGAQFKKLGFVAIISEIIRRVIS